MNDKILIDLGAISEETLGTAQENYCEDFGQPVGLGNVIPAELC